MQNKIQVGSSIKFVCRKGKIRQGEVESVAEVKTPHYSDFRDKVFHTGDMLVTIYDKGEYRNYYRSEMQNLEFVTE